MITCVFRKYPENFAFQLFKFYGNLSVKFAISFKISLLMKSLILSFLCINKTLRVNNSKIRAAMNNKISVFVICDALRYLVLFVQFKKREKHPWRSV